MKKRIVHVTTAHPRFDIRIFHKECISLSNNGYDVYEVVADGKGDGCHKGIQIRDIGTSKGRFKRMMLLPWKAIFISIKLKPHIIHIHDPELLIVGVICKLLGKKIIYDAHEDLPEQIKRKHWIPKSLRFSVSYLAKYTLRFILFFYNAVITATDDIAEKTNHSCVVTIKNYPIISEFSKVNTAPKKEQLFCYAGVITEDRGLFQMLDALPNDTKLVLAGVFHPASLQSVLHQRDQADNIEYLGLLTRKQIAELYSRSLAGLVLLKQGKGFEESLPIKLFEYMAASLPVISTDFPLWKKIVEECQCGFSVDSSDKDKIKVAMKKIILDPLLAAEMGQRGRKLVVEKFNWGRESEKLIRLYASL